ncbi:TPA: [FeFe] hydrogenase H-cluster maturation GTPase HydF [candidate division WOR-3 bacterium]|jgi:[FeFe] hydrogenase H-cluster maturation GTPase HydF|uniref:[FeFe] hydrogenase H-cluster maturation GTPase HydF n=1 Tax=candidate division WOR-3 bacterium TaxID=2052148 RepID=A0A350HBW6_UNCW3|nr:[FeFe] hydrogenase H-cluster maturation GTPase HydF [candidate division WOR-3 bacterium]
MKKELVSMRPHIGIFGKRNAGKSSLINALTGQNTAIVSDTPGTTTDPVGRAMEILPLGPVFIVDTAGLDDSGELGDKRVKKSLEVLGRTDLIVLVSASDDFSKIDMEFIDSMKKKNEKILVVFSKSDEAKPSNEIIINLNDKKIPFISVSAKTNENILALRETLAKMLPEVITSDVIIRDIVGKDDICVQVIPIDSAAPKGRVILPQEQVLRDCLDANSISVVVQTSELDSALKSLARRPKLVITDSQAIEDVARIVPADIDITTYSIVFSRLKGDLKEYVRGLKVLKELQDGDTIFIAEACTHHSQADDIGRVKLPKWIEKYTGKKLNFVMNPGQMIHKDLSNAKLVILCGSCMVNRKEVLCRIDTAKSYDIPVTNYGIIISHIHGALGRTIRVFEDVYTLYQEIFIDGK